MKHSKETCFKLHGYPYWWHELKIRKSMNQVDETILVMQLLRVYSLNYLLSHNKNHLVAMLFKMIQVTKVFLFNALKWEIMMIRSSTMEQMTT